MTKWFAVPLILVMWCSEATAAVSLATAKVESVSVFEECVVLKLDGRPEAFVFPLSAASADAKLSAALAAHHARTDVELAHWGTGLCTSLDNEPDAAPSGARRYIYRLKSM